MKCIKFAGFLFLLLALSGCTLVVPDFSCNSSETEFSGSDVKINTTVYKKEGKTSKSLIIFPPTGGTNLIDRSYARKFCSNGYDVYVINGWSGDQETVTDLTIHQHFYSRAQKALGIVLDNIHTPFIGLIGTSVGALHASVAANIQTKIDSVFIIAGGAPIAEVVVTSKQDVMQKLKADRKKRYGFKSDKENIEAITKVFSLEPMKQGELYKTKDIGMAIATEDTVVNSDNQIKLKQYLQPTAVISLDNDHFWGIVNTWLFHDNEIISFFENSYSKRQP